MEVPKDIRAYNRHAWDRNVEKGDRWTVPVSPEAIAAARRGEWTILLTPVKPVPSHWFSPLAGCDVLALASGGGQQAPILAAAGARVTVLDNSPRQLAQDRFVAERESLVITTVEGDMRDLAMLADGSFDLVVHPCSNLFVPDVRPVWREAFRVLRPGGALLSGFLNSAFFIFDPFKLEEGQIEVRHSLPYSDVANLSAEELRRYTDRDEPLVFGHSLEDQIAGQLEAGFRLAGFYEDIFPGSPLARHMPSFIATRSIKPT